MNFQRIKTIDYERHCGILEIIKIKKKCNKSLYCYVSFILQENDNKENK